MLHLSLNVLTYLLQMILGLMYLNAIAVNFGKEGSDLDDIFPFSEGSINSAGDTLKVEVCVSDCPYVQNEPYLIDLIAADDACPLLQRDTVRVTM